MTFAGTSENMFLKISLVRIFQILQIVGSFEYFIQKSFTIQIVDLCIFKITKNILSNKILIVHI